MPHIDDITYIGDGVYMEIEYGQISLRVNDHRSPPVVYLEPEVLKNLIETAKTRGFIK